MLSSACPGLATTFRDVPGPGEHRLRVQPGRQDHPQRRIRLEVAVDLVGGGGQHQDARGDRGGPPRPGPQQRQPGQRQQHAGQGHPRPEHDSERQRVGKRPPHIVDQPRQQGDDPAGRHHDERHADRQPAHRGRPAGTSSAPAAAQPAAPRRVAPGHQPGQREQRADQQDDRQRPRRSATSRADSLPITPVSGTPLCIRTIGLLDRWPGSAEMDPPSTETVTGRCAAQFPGTDPRAWRRHRRQAARPLRNDCTHGALVSAYTWKRAKASAQIQSVTADLPANSANAPQAQP